MAVILIDGDGTCWPQVPHGFYSKVDIGSEAVLKELVAKGHKLVLWTCRNDSKENPYNYHLVDKTWREETSLGEAIRWFKDRDIPLAGINSYSPGEEFIGESAKPLADIIIDDTALGIPLREELVEVYSIKTNKKSKYLRRSKFVDWDKVRGLLVSIGIL